MQQVAPILVLGRILQMTPHYWLNPARLQEASRLIARTPMAVAQRRLAHRRIKQHLLTALIR